MRILELYWKNHKNKHLLKIRDTYDEEITSSGNFWQKQ